jgi:hypothetical protein
MAESTHAGSDDPHLTVAADPGTSTAQADGEHHAAPPGDAAGDTGNDAERAITTTAADATTPAIGPVTAATAPPPSGRRGTPVPALTTLADVPLAGRWEDQLGYLAYADALCGLIDNPNTPTPLTVAVSAAWGAGKTSLVNLVTGRLAERTRRRRGRGHIVCEFPAWLHDDAPHLGASLAAKVARDVNRYRPWRRRLLNPLPSAMLTPEQRWRRRVALGVAALGVAVLLLLPASVRSTVRPPAGATAPVRALLGHQWAALGVLLLTVLALWPKVFTSAQAAARFVDDPKSEAATGSMWQVREQLGRLIGDATSTPSLVGIWLRRRWPELARLIPRYSPERRRLVLIIDDLERCRPPRAIDVCEVASQLLGHRDVVTILVADMATLAASAEIRYAALETIPTSTTSTTSQTEGDSADPRQAKGAYGRLYLQKMVQIQFDLPPPSLAGLRSMLTAQADEDADANDTAATKVVARRPSLRPILGVLTTIPIVAAAIVGAVRKPVLVVGILLAAVTTAAVGVFVGLKAAVIAAPVIVVVLIGMAIGITVPRAVLSVADARQRLEESRRTPGRGALHTAAQMASALVGGGPITTILVETAAEVLARLAEDQAERDITDDSPQRSAGEAEILKFLTNDDVPRRAKRMVNHLRLLLLVASKRRMFGGTPPLQAVHLGKWVVLWERWPELGRAIQANPSVMALLEDTAETDPHALGDVLRTTVPTLALSSDLARFLSDQEAKLGRVVERLLFYEPARQAA